MTKKTSKFDAFYCRHTTIQALKFWGGFFYETLTSRDLLRLVDLRLNQTQVQIVEGSENIVTNQTFVLAVNHYGEQMTFDVIAALFAAIHVIRPEILNRWLIVVGQRQPNYQKGKIKESIIQYIRNLVAIFYKRWDNHVIRIPLDNELPSIKSLRAWRKRCLLQPMVVFPEGKVDLEFDAVRPGTGKWLSSLNVPIIPVGIWYHQTQWYIRLGHAINWSTEIELRDIQLNLCIASLLPTVLVEVWHDDLRQWKLSHENLNGKTKRSDH